MAQYSLTTLAQVLKRFYSPWITKALNNEWLPLKRIKGKAKELTIKGSTLYFAVHYGRSGSVRAGSEAGALPTAAVQKYQQANQQNSFQYATIQFTHHAMKRVKQGDGAFISTLSDNMMDTKNDMLASVARQIMGAGNGIITTLSAAVNGASPTLKLVDASKLEIGNFIDVVQAAAISSSRITAGSYCEVTGIDLDANTITTSTGTTASTAAGDAIIIYGAHDGSNTSYETVGLQQICDNTSTLHDLDVSTYPWWKAQVVNNAEGAAGAINFAKLHKLIQNLMIRGEYPTAIYCTYGVKRAIINAMESQKRYVDKVKIDPGTQVTAFSSDMGPIPIIADRWCPAEKALVVNEKKLHWSQLGGEPSFMDEDGAALSRESGYPLFSAVLSWYPQLLCSDRTKMGTLQYIAEEN